MAGSDFGRVDGRKCLSWMLFGLLPNPPLRPGGADRPRFAFIAESVCVPSARSHWEGVVGLTPVLPELTQHPA